MLQYGAQGIAKRDKSAFVTTDGLTECPHTSFDDPQEIMKVFDHTKSHSNAVRHLLKDIQENGVRDSTTIVSWTVNIDKNASEPSNK